MIMRPILALALICGTLFSASYEPVDASKLMTTQNEGSYVNLPEAFKRIDEIYLRCRSIPMDFDNKEDEKQAYLDIQKLQNLLMTLDRQNYVETQPIEISSAYLLRKARLYVSANGFGVADAYNKADIFYNFAASEDISNSNIHLEYANYLGGLGEMDHAKSEFKWALDQGERKALLGLAIIYSLEGYRDSAIEYLKAFEQSYSKNQFTKSLAEEILKGNSAQIDNGIFKHPAYLTNF